MTDKTILIIPISWWYWEDRNNLWAISQWKKGISPLLCWTVGSPDVVSFGSVAAALCRGAKLKEAVQLMKQMIAADLRIDTWYHLVRMWRVLHPFTQDAEEIRIQYDHYYWSSIFCCSLFFFLGGRFAICSGDFLGMFWVNWWKTSVVWRFGPPKPKDLIIVPKRLALSRGIPPRQPMRDEVTISYWDRPELVVNVEFWSTTSTLENPAWQLNSVCLDMQRADPGNEDLQWWSLLG